MMNENQVINSRRKPKQGAPDPGQCCLSRLPLTPLLLLGAWQGVPRRRDGQGLGPGAWNGWGWKCELGTEVVGPEKVGDGSVRAWPS